MLLSTLRFSPVLAQLTTILAPQLSYCFPNNLRFLLLLQAADVDRGRLGILESLAEQLRGLLRRAGQPVPQVLAGGFLAEQVLPRYVAALVPVV